MPSLQQLIAISLLLTVAEKVVEAQPMTPEDLSLLRTATDEVRAAFTGSTFGSEVKNTA